jgi:hypothetical protein
MAKTTYTVPEVPGSSRVSERAYTHAVVGTFNPGRYLQSYLDQHEYDVKTNNPYRAVNHARSVLVAKAAVGDMVARPWVKCRPGIQWDVEYKAGKVTEHDIAEAQKHIARYPTAEAELAEVEAKHQERVAKIQAMTADKEVLQWSMSEVNARKALGGKGWTARTGSFGHYDNLHVVPCVAVEKKAKVTA